MGDRYHVRIPESIDEKMSAWPLPADVRRAMESRLRDVLGASPKDNLTPCLAPWGQRLNLLAFALPCPVRPSRTYRFMFHAVYGEGENTIDIVECGLIEHDTRPDT